MKRSPSSASRFLEASETCPPEIRRGVVIDLNAAGEFSVAVLVKPTYSLVCDWLETSEVGVSRIGIGDHVLVWCPTDTSERGIVLGRVTRYRAIEGSKPAKDHVALEAAESLTLTCGESSLQLRKDGKVMVLGKDILTRAKRTARIKGGSVAIN